MKDNIVFENMRRAFVNFADSSHPIKNVTALQSKVPHPVYNSVLPNDDNDNIASTDVIEPVEMFYKERKKSCFWWVPEVEKYSTLSTALRSANYSVAANFTGMVFDLTKTLPDAILSSDIEFIKVNEAKQLDGLLVPIERCFKFPKDCASALLAKFKSDFSSNYLSHYLILKNNKTIGGGSILHEEAKTTCGLYNFCVLPEHQKQGIGSLFQAFRLHQAKKMGYQYVTLYSSDDALKINEKLGFSSVHKMKGFMKM
jgi:GNAT superfamily N-acetyltransferase